MRITLKRATGFYAMASPLTIFVNGEKQGCLAQNQERILEVPINATIQVRFFWLQSNIVQLTPIDLAKCYVVKSNLPIYYFYSSVFIATIFLSLLWPNSWLIFGIVLVYCFFLAFSVKKFYVIEEENHG